MLRYIGGAISNFFEGQTSFMPRTRMLNEQRCMKIWRTAGFDVFRQPVELPPIAIDGPHLVFEYIPGRPLKYFFFDPEIPKADKLITFEQFLSEWGRRHFLAHKYQNRYLIQEHPTFQHVYMSAEGRRFIFYDFEIVYTRVHCLADLIGREIAGYIRSLPPEDSDDYLPILVREYPYPEFLGYPFGYFFRHPNPV